MKLQVVHRTRHQYAAPVKDNFNETRLRPVTTDGQTCDSFLLKILPPVRLSHYLDFYFNYVQYFEVLEPHSALSIESTATVSTSARPLPDAAQAVPLNRLEECGRSERCYDFLQPSPYVDLSAEVWRLAVDACTGLNEVWAAALGIMGFVHTQFAYAPLSTHVDTPMLEVLQQRRGVCQDFAHVMLGMCRTLKIPARYVSGYLYNGPTDRLTGAQASHAWCEVFVPEAGWLALDPTNNQPADERYVKVAVGRDYGDVAPVRGHYKGSAARSLSVEVLVEQVR